MHSHRIPNSDLTIAIRDRLNNLQDIWKPGVAAIQRRLHAHERALRLLIRATMVLGVVATTGLVFAWNATPSPQGLATWVHTQDTLHHAPYTTYAAINPTMDHALVAIEDERFYTHHGIDTIGLLRAAWDDLKARQFIEGGSTLTGQLAKNAYLQGNDRSVGRKLEDLILAVKIEQRYSKSQILELYLNLVYFGDGAYGIGAASQHYFGVSPAQLDVAQSSLLAGLVQAPSAYDPYCHPQLARVRQMAVLAGMVAEGYITPSQERAAAQQAPGLRPAFTPSQPDRYC